jgi:apolipoprotein N-acyltransferase
MILPILILSQRQELPGSLFCLPCINYICKKNILKRFPKIYLALITAVLLIVAWPPFTFNFLAFVALVPMLYLWQLPMKNRVFWGYSFLCVLIWNIGVTYWLVNATWVGGIASYLFNTLCMSLPWLWSYKVRKRFGITIGYVALLISNLSLEWLHHNWEINWPWLSLGNIFANKLNWVQWYEFTGIAGGTLWIWLVNILCIEAIIIRGEHAQRNKQFANIFFALLIIFFPIYISGKLYLPYKNTANTPNMVVVQPNIDSYNEKFVPELMQYNLHKIMTLSAGKIDNETAVVLWPETAVPIYVNENSKYSNNQYDTIFKFIDANPNIQLLTGINSYNYLSNDAEKQQFTRVDKRNGLLYNEYNTAAYLDVNDSMYLYHKSKLVPGVEHMPYKKYLGFLDFLLADWGGGGMYGMQKERTVFKSLTSPYKMAPIICYESVFGEYVTAYVRNGANVLGVITNDSWWGNTAGHKQLLMYAALRAVETRRYIARSANTGISCFIDYNGAIHEPLAYNTKGAAKMAIPTNDEITFYVKYGDYIYIMAVAMFLLLFVINIVMKYLIKTPNIHAV